MWIFLFQAWVLVDSFQFVLYYSHFVPFGFSTIEISIRTRYFIYEKQSITEKESVLKELKQIWKTCRQPRAILLPTFSSLRSFARLLFLISFFIAHECCLYGCYLRVLNANQTIEDDLFQTHYKTNAVNSSIFFRLSS